MQEWSISQVSEDCLLVEWELESLGTDQANRALLAKIANLSNRLLAEASIIVNVTPAYQSCLVQFELLESDYEFVKSLVDRVLTQSTTLTEFEPVLHQIPVFYDESVAADLGQLCFDKNLSQKQFIELHSAPVYDVYAVGFLPGFAYLGYVPEQLETPRHESFRANVPAGSVAIADRQTAVYPCESPGGWKIVGRTPMSLLRDKQSILKIGDQVQYVSIDRSEYLSLGGL